MMTRRLPQTDSIQELARFWDTHDLTDFEDQLEEVAEPVFERQTVIEKAINATNVENDIGFSGADAEICSSFAKQLLQKRILSTKQMAIVFKKAKKYRKQLLSITDKDKLFTCMIKDGVITQGDLVVWKEKEKGKWFLKAL